MKQITWRKGLFVVLAILQVSAALYMVWRWEDILQTGQSYRWQTAPVDPYDALRGRYVRFSFKGIKVPLVGEAVPGVGQRAYALIGRDEKGYAVLQGVQSERPRKGEYVRVKVQQVSAGFVSVNLPFDRFYLEESLAPEAEKAFRAAAGQESSVAVRIKNGDAVVEELYIENIPLLDYLKR